MHAKKDSSLSLLVYIYKNPLYSLCFLLPSDIVHIRVYVLFIVLVEDHDTEKKEYQKKSKKNLYPGTLVHKIPYIILSLINQIIIQGQ